MKEERTMSKQNFDLLLYGRAGSGKTTMCCTAPPPVHIIDVDGKANKIQAVTRAVKKGLVKVIDVSMPLMKGKIGSNFTKVDSKVNKIQKEDYDEPEGYLKIANTLNEYLEGKQECGTLVLDSLTRILDHMKRLIEHQNKEQLKKNRFLLWDIYLKSAEELITGALCANSNVIITAHELSVQFGDDNDDSAVEAVVDRKPYVQGQMQHKLSGYFSNVWRCDPKINKNKSEYRSLTRAVMHCEARACDEDMELYIPNDLRTCFPDAYGV